MPPAYKAQVVQARMRRKTVVLSAVCALGGIVFGLAAWRGLHRHESPASRSQVAIAVATAAEQPAPPPSVQPSPAASNVESRPAAATTSAKQGGPASAPAGAAGVAASPPRAMSPPKRSRSKGAFEL
jgi:hypothetical protein